ncbi:MAG: PAS domain S-box protein [Synergistaceae bacterium]|nr:PAS domain S-box protein [Synergistaceae bacterium]
MEATEPAGGAPVMSGVNSDFSTQDVSVRWLFLPPFTALATIVVVNLLSGDVRVPVDPALWGLTGLLFVILTVLYGIFIHQRFFSGLLPAQFIAQGLLLSPLSLHAGARMLQWVGVTMTVCGAVVLTALYYRRSRVVFHGAGGETAAELSSLPLPLAMTDGEGTILFASDALLRITGMRRERLERQKITFLLPLDRESVELAGKTWRILQTPMEGGKHCFRLEEVQESPVVVTLSSNFESDDAFIDPATTLFTRTYAVKSVTRELYRTRRYQRPMSAVLLRMVFTPGGGEMEQPEKEDEIFNAWCRFVRANIRASDISCLVGPRDVLVAMPETSPDMAREVAGKLASFDSRLQELTEGFTGGISLYDGVAFFGSASGDVDFDGFMKKLDDALQGAMNEE